MENGNTTPNPAPQGGPVKYCATCGAQLHIQAEICPKCGVRQAPPPNAPPQSVPPQTAPPSGASAGTGNTRNEMVKVWRIVLGVLFGILVVIVLIVVGPSRSKDENRGHNMGAESLPRNAAPPAPSRSSREIRAYNTRAESLLRNAATTEELLNSDYGAYGASQKGRLPGAGSGTIQLLFGPFPAASADREGAMISATGKNGRPAGYGIEVEAGVILIAGTDGDSAYFVATKHEQGDRVFLTTSHSNGYYFCENKAWIGKNEVPASTPENVAANVAGTPCGGSPVSTWQKL